MNNMSEIILYETIYGDLLPVHKLSAEEAIFFDKAALKYNDGMEWTKFAAWWNKGFQDNGFSTDSILYLICQDLEVRRGIKEGKVAEPTLTKEQCEEYKALKLLSIEVKDMLANYDVNGKIEAAALECLRTLVIRSDVRARKVKHL